ncbi:Tex family protein [Neptunomonas japonica]|uniref:Tex family protein n=1 Tax=Neptunomonas japonica TaxID=417574 RepID=UPI00041C8DC9|nr:Tex family protein [Neptunomonas japonica]
MTLAAQIAQELGVRTQQVAATITLLDEGATVPFIARYRKEITGALDDIQLRQLALRVDYLRILESRKQAILSSIEEQGKLTADLKIAITSADTKVRLEDLYLPYRPKRRTKAQVAREAGLEPLALQLLKTPCEPMQAAKQYINPEKQVLDQESALAGAQQILMEQFSEQADLLNRLRSWLWSNGITTVSVARGKASDDSKFRDYYDHKEPIRKMPSHRALAMFRGNKEGELKIALLAEPGMQQEPINIIQQHVGTPSGNGTRERWLQNCVEHTWTQKLHKQIETDLLKRLREEAETEAINVFARNLKDLLLAAPAGPKVTIGLDPGLRTGTKVAVVDATGKLLDHCTLYPHAPHKRWDEALNTLAKLTAKYKVSLISIGNGTASRETEQLAKDLSKRHPELNFTAVMVSEAGASVYSASELASREFPDLDVTIRGAVSIARRLQDPLAELVKIDPKAIGVGQYQHDVDQKSLAGSLENVVEDGVNHVGVDLNTASCELLTQVAGLNRTTAQNIIDYRDKEGRFTDRKQLLKVPRLGAKAFEQCAAFLRIREGKQPLDNSAVHPESYALVDNMADTLRCKTTELMGNGGLIKTLTTQQFVSAQYGEYTVRDVIAELDKPGRDPRPEFKTAQFADGIETIKDLHLDMLLEGVITNVTNFGAFVDIGVHQDGLVHISQLSDQFVKDPHTLVKTGDIVQVRVTDVDEARRRIALSMKSQAEPAKAAAVDQRTTAKPATPKSNKTSSPHTNSHLNTGLAAGLKAAGFKVK